MKYKTSLDIMRGCMGCGKGITRACRLNAHMKKCKKLRALLECPICKKMLQSQDDMEDHIRFDHACTRCGFRNKCPDTVIEHTKMVPNCDHCVHCNKDISAEWSKDGPRMAQGWSNDGPRMVQGLSNDCQIMVQ